MGRRISLRALSNHQVGEANGCGVMAHIDKLQDSNPCPHNSF